MTTQNKKDSSASLAAVEAAGSIAASPASHVGWLGLDGVLKCSHDGRGNYKANAHLIAAAPTMYEALKAVEKHHAMLNAKAGRMEDHSTTLRIVRAAIAKAEVK